jgi:predicted ferric reductase
MTIHKTRRSSMALSYAGFGVTIVWIAVALAVVGAGWIELHFEAWRAAFLLAPLIVVLAIWRSAGSG